MAGLHHGLAALADPRRCIAVGGGANGGPAPQPPAPAQQRNPMELLHGVFQAHPSALRLHRELMISLAAGNAEEAADIASALAQTVKRVTAEPQERGANTEPVSAAGILDEGVAPSEVPPASADDLDEAVAAAKRAVLHGKAGGDGLSDPAASTGTDKAPRAADEFWRSPSELCVTLLESAFETEAPDDGAEAGALTEAGDRALAHEQQQMAVLDDYLTREADRWKQQKNAIAKAILDVARGVGLTPIDLHAAEGGGGADGRLNALRHANVVVRGEVPPSAAAGSPGSGDDAVEEGLAALKKRMVALHGRHLSREEEVMARYELLLAGSKMRYVVGLHRELQLAVDESEAVRRAQTAAATRAQPLVSGSQFFIQRVMEELHRLPETVDADYHAGTLSASVARVQLAESLSQPVLPFTFMLRCCLWFAVPDKE